MCIETRYILDFTDHVWVEFYSHLEKRWIHLDPCENAFDTPLVYEQGWGKKLNYVIAFGDYDVRDVTARYTLDFEQLKSRRRLGGESKILTYLSRITELSRQRVDNRMELFDRDVNEFRHSLQKNRVDWSSFVPRQSGSLEWRTIRGEMGDQ
jgi:peptide-N4-(N-acetyl-beta-glucosaminyl)asparagine amidase